MRIISWLIWIVLLLTSCSGCYGNEAKPKEDDLLHVKSKTDHPSKKVILILVDSLMYQSIDKGIQQNKLPTLKFLIDHGQYYKDLVSSFPTMSVTIDSSLLTGTYPDQHRVPGLIWYSAKENKIINYGTGPMEILKHGVDPVLSNAMIHLNGDHLNAQTLTMYEQLNKVGLKTGSINGLIYRGTVEHTLTIPEWIKGPTSLPAELKVKGPDFLSLGSFSNPLEGVKKMPDTLTRRMGFNNEYAVESVKYLVRNNKLPDFLYVYLPELDHELHKKGPSVIDGVIKMDKQLQSILNAFGSSKEALDQAIIIIVGDSGMSAILPDGKHPVIDLPQMLHNYSILQPGAEATSATDIALAVNETMAYVYKLNTKDSLKDIAEIMKEDTRIDFISWKESGWIHVIQAGTSKEFTYKPNGDITDSYGQSWTLGSNPDVLDLHINKPQNTLEYREYPDALKRLYGALNSHEGDFLVVSAKQGYELSGESSPTHKGGGGHGALHRTESLVPLIISGTNDKPDHARIVDLKSYILRLLAKPLGKSETTN
ncbi:alkaline phosphatase family protein [Paenibacillus glacialis]|uniref:Phosphodiesterase n=1 Tax=Paenibacillus glacialis TaxID=494026 RepID=A0A168JMN8_9BACL|nr:alkaline phosphatase family protein [Paenibacillus glacialis]OAB40845.1 phosphodiesterase [Paenibacillus glacialis]